jgi:hypothetical protein
MKIRKNLEAVFLAAAVMAIFASFATANVTTAAVAKHAQPTLVASATPMQVVVIKGHRLSATEKARAN